QGSSCSGSATFTWDGQAAATRPLAKSSGRCTATATITPPAADSAPGDHTVAGTSAGGGQVTATYRVNGNLPSPTPTTASPAPNPRPLPTPSAKASANPASGSSAT